MRLPRSPTVARNDARVYGVSTLGILGNLDHFRHLHLCSALFALSAVNFTLGTLAHFRHFRHFLFKVSNPQTLKSWKRLNRLPAFYNQTTWCYIIFSCTLFLIVLSSFLISRTALFVYTRLYLTHQKPLCGTLFAQLCNQHEPLECLSNIRGK